MKQYTKKWLLSFLITLTVLIASIIVFAFFVDTPSKSTSKQNVKSATKENKAESDVFGSEYIEYSENVGGVSFTEDQITELVRKIYYLDGFISNLSVDFIAEGGILISGKIKDVNMFCSEYPEAESFRYALELIENKIITIKVSVIDNNGMADLKLDGAFLGKMKIDENMLKPFLQESVFSQLIDVEYNSVQFTDEMIIFKDELPDILTY